MLFISRSFFSLHGDGTKGSLIVTSPNVTSAIVTSPNVILAKTVSSKMISPFKKIEK